MKKTLTLSFLILLSAIDMAFAGVSAKNSTKNDEENFQLFDTDIFSLSKKNEDAFDVASSIYVLSSDDIRRSGATSIPEALRLVPGLQVAKMDGHKWAISSRGFNGQFANKLLVMIDGRTVYTPLFSGVVWDLQDYVLEDVEKIEVIRGSGGAIWGANAVNGIINIITKNAVDTQGGYASAIVGNEDRAIAEVRYGGRTKSLNHYRFYAKQANHDGLNKINTDTSNKDGYRQSQAGFRYDIRSIEDNTISIHGDVSDGKAENYFQTLRAARSTDKDSQGGNLVVNWEKTISKKSSFTLQTYLDYDQFDTFVLARDGRTVDIDFQYFYDLNRQNQIIWGVGYRLIKDKIKENVSSGGAVTAGLFPLQYDQKKKNDEIYSAFLQDKISLVADTFYLTLGSKFEINDYTGSEIQPSAKFTLFPSRNQTIWASVSRATRTPTRGEEGITIKYGSTVINKGSLGYGSENVIAYEMGYRVKPTRTSLIDIAGFYNDYHNLRTFDKFGSDNPIADNLGYGESYGVEVSAKWQAMDNWRLEAGYDFLKTTLHLKANSTDFSAVGLQLSEEQSPNNQFRLRSNYNITPKIEFDNMVYYVDSLPLSGTTATAPGVPSYVRFDTRIGYLLNSNVDLSVGVQNIADKRHQEFANGLFANKTEVGRTIYFKTAVRF
jgi:iron complex outermembrane receptor protein